MKYKIKFTIEAGSEDEDGDFLFTTATLPFVPTPGTKLVVLPGDDYRKVDEVFWSKKDGIEVYLEFSAWSVKEMKKVGWKIG